MEKIATERRNKIITFIHSKRLSDNCRFTVDQVKNSLNQTGLDSVGKKTIKRDLDQLCNDHDALKVYKLSNPHHWYWDANEDLLELNITLDSTTAMSLLVAEKFFKDLLPPLPSIEHYFEQASDKLEDMSINQWISNKIEVVPLPHDENQPEVDDPEAFHEVLKALHNGKCFKAKYSKSAYDLSKLGKWEAKRVYAPYQIDEVHEMVYKPLGIVRRGAVYFLIADAINPSGVKSWKPNHFAMHKFSDVAVYSDRNVERKNFSLQQYIKSGVMNTAPNPMELKPQSINLEIYVSQAVGEYLYESSPHNLESVHCRACEGSRRRGDRDNRRGWQCFKGTTQDSEQLRRWLLSLKDVEVLTPAELRKYFKKEAEATLGYYQEA